MLRPLHLSLFVWTILMLMSAGLLYGSVLNGNRLLLDHLQIIFYPAFAALVFCIKFSTDFEKKQASKEGVQYTVGVLPGDPLSFRRETAYLFATDFLTLLFFLFALVDVSMWLIGEPLESSGVPMYAWLLFFIAAWVLLYCCIRILLWLASLYEKFRDSYVTVGPLIQEFVFSKSGLYGEFPINASLVAEIRRSDTTLEIFHRSPRLLYRWAAPIKLSLQFNKAEEAVDAALRLGFRV